MFSNFFEIIILSAIQGITEFLPISSSAHLILVNKISNLQIGSLYLDTGMHLGSLLAIIFFFRNDLIKISNYYWIILKVSVDLSVSVKTSAIKYGYYKLLSR